MMIRRCKTRGAFETVPEKPLRINLDKVKSKYEIIADLPILLIIKKDKYEITCYKSGKLMIKNCDLENVARKIFEEILEVAK